MLYGELTSPALGEIAKQTVALLPVGALEQHGRHLPVLTDTTIVSGIATRIECALPQKVLLLPTLWVGSSHHHLGFSGTVSVSSELYIKLIMEIVESIALTGFKRIFILNGHGGNITPGNEVLYRLNQKWKGPQEPWVVMSAYWHLARNALSSQKFMESQTLSHACEYETSLMLALRKEWVHLRKAKGYHPKKHSRFYDPLGYEPSRVSISQSYDQITPIGALGQPELATPEKGYKLLDLICSVVIEFIEEFITWKYPKKKPRTRS